MPSVEKSLDRQRLTKLADSLAVALTYITAIDDAVDPFDEIDKDATWRICSLTAAAKYELFNGVCSGAFEADTSSIINATHNQRKIDVRQTELYSECLNAVRQLVRRIQ